MTFLGNYCPAIETTLCGISAVKYLERELLQKGIPPTFEDLVQAHELARRLFAASLTGLVTAFRPWIWASGLDPAAQGRLTDLLIQHGVPEAQVGTRIALAIQALGLFQVQKGILSNQPWKTLKSIANQARPTFQWILPAELSAAVEKKGKDSDKPRKGKVTKAKKATVPVLPPALDPVKLKFDTNTFTSASGKSLIQVQTKQLGPLCEGVALANVAMVDKFLMSPEPLTDGALAVFLVDTQEPQTALVWSQLRVAIRCIANNEPVLVAGALVQLGRDMVAKLSTPAVASVSSASVACAKIAVYRDSIEGSWDSFCKSPVKYVVAHLQCLDTCTVADCDCNKWHRGPDDVTSSPILDVWRKQWVNLSFHPVCAQGADVFLMNVRHVDSCALPVLAMSGQAGIFAEPRSIDARSASSLFQIIWVPRSSLEEVLHLRQVNPDIVGVARMGSRYGLRVDSAKAAQVSS